MRAVLAGVAMVALAGCAATSGEPLGDSVITAKAIRDLERRSGGRLGIAVVDGGGRLVSAGRGHERFAMCSTFKLLLAGQLLERAAKGVSLRTPLAFTRADLVSYSPGTERLLGPDGRGEQRLGLAARDAVVLSDNTAANLILTQIGGPSAFTAALRRAGDSVTRLDRNEPELNENALGDERDTTSPIAMATSAASYVYGNRLQPEYRKQLRGWMIESQTGLKRIRAGLPQGWIAGDKTGSCGNAYNDVAFVETPGGRKYVIAVYLDRPAVKGDAASAIIAEATRITVTDLPD
ncbi:beta-lactamase class A [Sphingopyxis sp. YR583]|uniref:class A beta-lactamase n=1 Tax=Sphingopyxis sp. YR583 TaxID=1881047 RepID=UPI0008A73515|nr:class A beta-lactamase [Sphingopyxis sp. YR583]SEH20180.1 beta-lactamase class A [Sphingopyxis sp. YR583]